MTDLKPVTGTDELPIIGAETWMVNDAVMGFALYDAIYAEDDDITWDKDAIATGSIKFDGCANIDFSPNGIMLHLCGMHTWDRLTEAMRALYTEARERINGWLGEEDQA